MPPKRKSAKKSKRRCVCGSDCHDKDAYLPGLLLLAFGAIAIPANLGIIPGMQWIQAWPLAVVLLGAVLIVRVGVCRSKSKK